VRISPHIWARLLVSSPVPPGSDPSSLLSSKFMLRRCFMPCYARRRAFMLFVRASPCRSSMPTPLRPCCHPHCESQQTTTMAGARWPFSRKGKKNHEASGSRRRRSLYVPVRMARRLYACGQPMPWPDVNLPERWHLNSRWVPVQPVLMARNGFRRSVVDAPCFPLRCSAIQRSPSSPRCGTHSHAGSRTRSGVPATSATGTGTAPGS
jgi:hypothetical protein